jgi:hypothetical protein
MLFFHRNFDSPTENPKVFKFYLYYTFGFTFFLSALVVIASPRFSYRDHVLYYLVLSLFMLAVADVILFILTHFKIDEISRTGNFEASTRFQVDIERFAKLINARIFSISNACLSQILELHATSWNTSRHLFS